MFYMALGIASMHLCAGRETKDDIIDPAAGIVLNKKLGDSVAKGDSLLTFYTERPDMQGMISDILNCFDITADPISEPKVVEELITYDQKSKDFVITKE